MQALGAAHPCRVLPFPMWAPVGKAGGSEVPSSCAKLPSLQVILSIVSARREP